MNKIGKGYLMVGGVLAPAFIAVGLVSLLTKKNIDFKSSLFILTFAGASVVGGYVSANMLKGI